MLKNLLNNKIIFYNEVEINFWTRFLPLIIIFFIVMNIIGSVYLMSFEANLWKFIIIEIIFIITLLNPLNGIYIVLLTVPFEFSEVWFKYHIIKLYRITIFFIFISWGFRKIIQKNYTFIKYFKNKITILFIIFIMWNVITLFYSVLWLDGLGEVIRMSFYFAFYIIFMDIVKEKKYIINYFFILIFMGYLTGILGVYEKISGNNVYYPAGALRSASTFFDPNMFGRYMAVFAIILGAVLLFQKHKKRIVYWLYPLGFLLSLIAILFAESRSSLLALVSGYFILIWFHKKKKVLLLIFIFLLIVSYIILPVKYKSRIQSIMDFHINTTKFEGNMGRIALERAGLQIIKHHFIFGCGLGSFPHFFFKYNDIPYDASESHNFLTRTFAELGIIGFIFTLYIIGFILSELYKKIRIINYNENEHFLWISICLFAIFIAVFIHSIFYSDFFYYFYVWFFISIFFKLEELIKVK